MRRTRAESRAHTEIHGAEAEHEITVRIGSGMELENGFTANPSPENSVREHERDIRRSDV